jgi:predicted SprT family Zn-dependent metalloprotease
MPVSTATLDPTHTAVSSLASDLFAAHGLAGWTFGFNRRKQAMGMCFYDRRAIELSVHFVARNSADEIRDTLLHEIAHALVGPGHGHDAVWQAKCLEVGARPVRCGDAAMPDGRWQATCNSCGLRHHKHRRPKRMRGWYCARCGVLRGQLVWEQA